MPGPPTPVTGPPLRPPFGGLLQLAAAHPDEGERPGGWENGLAFAPDTCADGLAHSIVCQTDQEKLVETNPDAVEYTPFVVIGWDHCTVLDRGRDRPGRARRHLRAIESHQIERVLWTGEADGDETPNGGDRPHLADGQATPLAAGAALPLTGGMALLDQALTGCLHGQPGMVHVTPLVAAYAAAAQLVEWRDNRWVTPNGHTLVAGSGYPGTGPRPDTGDPLPTAPDLTAWPPEPQWIYGTGQVVTLLGDPIVLDDIDRPTNHQTVRVERPAAAFYPPCCQFAAQIQPSEETS